MAGILVNELRVGEMLGWMVFPLFGVEFVDGLSQNEVNDIVGVLAV